MASKFDIEIQIPDDPKAHPRVRVIDCDQDETTGWIKVPKGLRGQSDQVILAAAFLRSWRIQAMLETASQVAYAVWLGEKLLDVHAFIPQAQAILDQAQLTKQLEKRTAPARGPGRRPRL